MNADGRVSVSLDGKVRENVTYLPRLGFEITLTGKNMPFRYYGCGPLESGNAFECNVSSYSVDAIDRAEHTDELVCDGKTHLRIDYKVSGIGSNSCGPELLDQYRLSDKQIGFCFVISPLYKTIE